MILLFVNCTTNIISRHKIQNLAIKNQ